MLHFPHCLSAYRPFNSEGRTKRYMGVWMLNGKRSKNKAVSGTWHSQSGWVPDRVRAMVQHRVIKEPLLFPSTSSSEAIWKCDIAEAVSFRPSGLTSLILHLLPLSDISKPFSTQRKTSGSQKFCERLHIRKPFDLAFLRTFL